METQAFMHGWTVVLAAVSPETTAAATIAIQGAGTGQFGIGPAGATNQLKREIAENDAPGLNATRDSAVTVNPRALP